MRSLQGWQMQALKTPIAMTVTVSCVVCATKVRAFRRGLCCCPVFWRIRCQSARRGRMQPACLRH